MKNWKIGVSVPQMKNTLISTLFCHFRVKLSSKVKDGSLVIGIDKYSNKQTKAR